MKASRSFPPNSVAKPSKPKLGLSLISILWLKHSLKFWMFQLFPIWFRFWWKSSSILLNWFAIIVISDVTNAIWSPPSQSELTLIIFDMELTHLGSETSICVKVFCYYLDKSNLFNFITLSLSLFNISYIIFIINHLYIGYNTIYSYIYISYKLDSFHVAQVMEI